ncbi:MAG: peptidylprolyl isomerase [Mycobacteriales bacterium]
MTRPPRRLALAGLAVLLLSGCGNGQLRPGAAALVGEERITSDSLRQVVDRGLADPQAAQQLGADRVAFQRQTLARLLNREILDAAAQAEGVTVSQGEVDALLEQFVMQVGSRETLEQQAAQSGIAPEDLTPFVRDIVLDMKLADQLTQDVEVPPEQLQAAYDQNIAQYDQVRSRHILVPDEPTARTILEQVRQDPSRFAALAAEFSIDTSNKDMGGDLGLAGRGQFVPAFEQVLFNSEPGTFEIVQTQFGWHVVNVVERQTTTLAQATPELRRAVLQEQRQQASAQLLRDTAERLGVTVNPRFGRWNAETGTVEPVQSPNGVLTPAPANGQPPGGTPLRERPGGGARVEQSPAPAPAG